jgi:hypothetical protein
VCARLPGPAGGIRAVAEGEWAATFTYSTGGPQAIDMARRGLEPCRARWDAAGFPLAASFANNAAYLRIIGLALSGVIAVVGTVTVVGTLSVSRRLFALAAWQCDNPTLFR